MGSRGTAGPSGAPVSWSKRHSSFVKLIRVDVSLICLFVLSIRVLRVSLDPLESLVSPDLP